MGYENYVGLKDNFWNRSSKGFIQFIITQRAATQAETSEIVYYRMWIQ